MRAASGCYRTWRRPTRSWWRWTRPGRGSATTSCSPGCWHWSCAAPRRERLPGYTGPPPAGSPGTGTRWRRAGTVHELLAGFPAEQLVADAELTAVAAGDELARGSLEAAERYLGLAERASASVPGGRRGQAQLLLGIVRLLLARQRGDPPAVAEQARRLQAMTEAPDAARPGLGEELRALALISLGSTEFWA